MLYRIIGEEVSTHRPIEIPNWEAPNIAAAKRSALEIGIKVTKIVPLNPKGHKSHANIEVTAKSASEKLECLSQPQGTNSCDASALHEPEDEPMFDCPSCFRPLSETAKRCPECGLIITPELVATARERLQMTMREAEHAATKAASDARRMEFMALAGVVAITAVVVLWSWDSLFTAESQSKSCASEVKRVGGTMAQGFSRD